MQEETSVLLSRYLDDDLEPQEAAQLEERFRTEPELAAELESLQRLKRGVANLAAREQPPAQLDQLVEPLLLGRPTPVRVRPWVRWLATAAAIVLGVTVIFEVNRARFPDRVGSARQSRAVTPKAQPGERFSLAPLPTSSLPEEEQPLGATDRILASPIPEVALSAPPALEVLGPLEKKRGSVDDEDLDQARRADSAVAFGATEPGNDRPGASDPTNEALEGQATSPSAPGSTGFLSEDAVDTQAPARWNNQGPGSRGHLYIFMDGETAWQNFETEMRCQSGRYVVRIRVNNEVVRDVWPVGIPPATPSQRLCAAEIISGLKIENVPDGEYPAEVVVERRGTRN
jgi:hypothetical protein